MSHSHEAEIPQGDHFVTPEQYGLPRSSSQQKLTPLDMNMPRVYGARWILCFPLPPGTNKAQVYVLSGCFLTYRYHKGSHKHIEDMRT